MAIRRPSFSSPDWLIQDFLYQEDVSLTGSELRYIEIKWDGQVYERLSQAFDYSDPPYVGPEQRGGSIVGRIDYEINRLTKVVTIYSWEVNWRDEWPLRIGTAYLTGCLFPGIKGYTLRVSGDQVYSQNGTPIENPNKEPYAFWVSERFFPLSNLPKDYLVQ